MNLSLNLVFPLFLLMPGLAVAFRALEQTGSVVKRPALATNSVAGLALIPFISFVAHLAFALVFGVQDWLCDKGLYLFDVPFQPNPYLTIYYGTSGKTVAPAEAWITVFWGLTLPIWTLIYWHHQTKLVKWINCRCYDEKDRWPTETRIEYLDRLQSSSDDTSLVAEVVLKEPRPDKSPGYIGIVDEIRLNADDTVASITLLGAINLTSSGNDQSEQENLHQIQTQAPFKIHGSELLGVTFHLIDESDVKDFDEEKSDGSENQLEFGFDFRTRAGG